MFPSACSLRSTQCAALIALATAAGISRFESGTTANAADTSVSPHATHSALTSVRVTCFRLALNVLAPWLRAADVSRAAIASDSTSDAGDNAPPTADSLHAAAGPSEPIVVTAPLVAGEVTSAPRMIAALSPQHHSFPYAVGPPASAQPSHRLVAGTPVPCDSATRPVVTPRVSRIASVEFVSAARLARHESAGAFVARPTFGQVVLRDTAASLLAGSLAATSFAFAAPAASSASFVSVL